MKIESETLREGRDRFFATHGFSEEAYKDRWFRFNLGPIPLWLPNLPGRAKAVGTHDLHHVLTGYEPTFLGEGEIGAWELASGCRNLWAAWGYNLLAVMTAFVLAPGRVWRAFARGRRSKNLYGTRIDDQLLESPIETLRAELGL